ncbi:hypothetical protein STRTUCAR8_02028, partial [Streptomyces turgidiscabies Car8]
MSRLDRGPVCGQPAHGPCVDHLPDGQDNPGPGAVRAVDGDHRAVDDLLDVLDEGGLDLGERTRLCSAHGGTSDSGVRREGKGP